MSECFTILTNVWETGSVTRNEPGVKPGRYPPEAQDLVLQAFEDDPTTSTKQVAADVSLSPWNVWSNMMHREQKYLFHGIGVQGLEDGDPIRRS
ncbi:unnamed protein product [Acanthoscelides obtectus]|uniref:Uncharacterized protein n=1 Tax=Acanthoscelides obtectus TaxID=200917 RepID=A0A9P0KLC0_ACAOB|nr:unnamed protein product [Acanthoscelides obtectus]CAK1635779.1 hypothetical protein AOBTE_LOCUS9495 [Acanthoscelides obtectus]